MTISYGPKLGLLENAATGEVHDDAFRKFLRGMDGMTQLSVKDKDLSTPPGSPLNGDCYLIAASPAPTGAWAGGANKIARYSSHAAAWEIWTPYAGWICWVQDESTEYRYNGTAWGLVANIEHNNTTNKQGGTTGEYYHLTSAQSTQVSQLNGTAGKTLAYTQSLTLAGTDGTTMTFPTTSASLARKDATETFAGRVLLDDTTDATTTTDGSLQTDGGLSVAKKIFAGKEITANSVDNIVFHAIGANNGSQIQFKSSTNTNGFTCGITGSTDGDFIIYDNAGVILLKFSKETFTGSFAKKVNIYDLTDATTTTDGSLQTDGGLSVAKNAVFGGYIKAKYKSSDGSTGATGTFTTADSKTVTVKDGIVTSIV